MFCPATGTMIGTTWRSTHFSGETIFSQGLSLWYYLARTEKMFTTTERCTQNSICLEMLVVFSMQPEFLAYIWLMFWEYLTMRLSWLVKFSNKIVKRRMDLKGQCHFWKKAFPIVKKLRLRSKREIKYLNHTSVPAKREDGNNTCKSEKEWWKV